MRFTAGVLFTLLAVAPRVETEIEVVYETIVIELQPEQPTPAETPIIDSLMTDEDWQRIDRESDCLFDYLRLHLGWEITLDAVLAAGYWTDVLGGPCAVMEEITHGADH